MRLLRIVVHEQKRSKRITKLHTEEEGQQLRNIDTLTDLIPIPEPTGDFFDTEEVLSNLEQSIYSITGDIDTAFRLDTESDQSIIEENLKTRTPLQIKRDPGNTPEATPAVIVNMTKEEELKKLSEEYVRANNDTEREVVQKKVSEGDILQFLIEVTKNSNLDTNVRKKLSEGIAKAVSSKTPVLSTAGTSQSFVQLLG